MLLLFVVVCAFCIGLGIGVVIMIRNLSKRKEGRGFDIRAPKDLP